MTRLEWHVPGQKYYEAGIDRGVLYVNGSGSAWIGLVSVNEEPTGGEPRPFYIDGVKYLNIASAEEYAATIEAYSSPAEFAACDGMLQVHKGLFATQQRRKSFGFSYRTRVGNDLDGPSHAYKIHIVYNALAAPSPRTNASTSDTTEGAKKTWAITTQAPPLSMIRPTAHFIIDTREADAADVQTLEGILYGDDSSPARLPSPDELVAIFA